MGKIRLDRLLSQSTGLSRKQARGQIKARKVTCDGELVNNASQLMDESSVLRWRGESFALRGSIYLMMHKPAGLVCATQDLDEPTVMGLLPEEWMEKLHIVGRLDKDTTGLLLLTDDGDWSHRVASPKYRSAKVYRAFLAEDLVNDAEERFAEGILLRGESKPTLPAKLQRVQPREALLTLHEGRYHQVKRMFAALNNRVVKLHREQIGGLALDPEVEEEDWRELTVEEVEAVFLN